MPIYTYECKKCGHVFDATQRMNDDRLTDCPECGEPKTLQRLIGSVGIVFKGEGFPGNDMKKES